MKFIGTRLYYCLLTGNVLAIQEDRFGFIEEYTVEQDFERFKSLHGITRDTVGILEFEYGEYAKLSENSTGVKVNLETKELIFSYDELPVPPSEPTINDIVQEQGNKISILEKENADLLLDSAMKDIKIKTVEHDVADLTLLIAQGGM